MAAETLNFACPYCHVRLKVPAASAGVTGPCPACREQITAPLPAAPPARVTGGPAALVSGTGQEVAARPGEPGGKRAPAMDSPRIRPEPAQPLGEVPSQAIPPSASTDDPPLSPGTVARSRQASSSRRPYRVLYALFPAVFLVLAATIVGLLLYHFGPVGPAQRIASASRPLGVRPPFSPAKPAVQAIDSEAVDHAAADRFPDLAGGPPRDPQKLPALLANELLDAFLSAPDAATRVGMVEPAATEQELAATLLKGPLPEVARIIPEPPRQHPEELATDFPYRVSFRIKDAPAEEFAVLVRQRGTQPPKLFLPAFLDLAGGRLAEFTRQPHSRPPATFHVHLEPIDGCYEKNIPGAERKFTLKLLPGPASKETARAYAANVSRLRTQVESPSYPIRWGMRRRATVILQWNHKEDPARPYLELIDITSPDWNP